MQEGERLQIFYELDDNWQPSGIFIAVPAGGSALKDSGLHGLAPQDIACPHCHAAAVTDSLHAGEPCPQCKHGVVEEGGTCIY